VQVKAVKAVLRATSDLGSLLSTVDLEQLLQPPSPGSAGREVSSVESALAIQEDLAALRERIGEWGMGQRWESDG
jgi:hypothetical protein